VDTGPLVAFLNRRTVVLAKRRQVLATIGRLACEACGFDFRGFYGDLGAEFCEVHHRVPLSEAEAEVETRLEDLAVVCSNCHRMLRRAEPFLTLEQLRGRIAEANCALYGPGAAKEFGCATADCEH
jgi:5-methylcytosine-specific restriction protein A